MRNSFPEQSKIILRFRGGKGHGVNGIRASSQTSKEVVIFSLVQSTMRVNETMLLTIVCE